VPKILVVDDEQDITTVIKMALEAHDFEVDAFNKPEDALSNFKAGAYDMMIADIRMPGMSGFELYREVKKIDDNIKVAFMTAFEIYEDEFRKMLPKVDVKCFIKKPVRMSDLLTRVKEELTIAPDLPDSKGS
jgi:two-component system, OmpR family, response regulator ChvI